MIEKNVIEFEKDCEIKHHSSVNNVQIIDGKLNFPIDMLKQEGFCEYQIYLKHVKNIETSKNKIPHGIEIKNQLEDIFKKDSDEITLKDAVKSSKTQALMARNFFVMSNQYGIRGYVDEIWMKEDEIILINEAQGRTPYESTMNPVRAACLAFKDMVDDERKVKAGLLERGTENLFWIEVFDKKAENDIKKHINRVNELINGSAEYQPIKESNKCRICEFRHNCEYSNE